MAERQVLLLQIETILILTEAVTIIQTEVQVTLPEATIAAATTHLEVIHHQAADLHVLIAVAAVAEA